MGPYNLTTIIVILLGASQAVISTCLVYKTTGEGFPTGLTAFSALLVCGGFFIGSATWRYGRWLGGFILMCGALALFVLAIPEFSAVTAGGQPHAAFLVASVLVKWLLIAWIYAAAARASINRA